MKIRPVGAELFRKDGGTDRQTDEADSCFPQFCGSVKSNCVIVAASGKMSYRTGWESVRVSESQWESERVSESQWESERVSESQWESVSPNTRISDLLTN